VRGRRASNACALQLSGKGRGSIRLTSAKVLWLVDRSPLSIHPPIHPPHPGDARTAADARKFILGWLQRFPQYAESPLYIAGESYGGGG